MRVVVSNASPEPIYEQITRQIRQQIISGDLEEGVPLPSIRRLAKELQVSVITTQRAYDDLEQEGFRGRAQTLRGGRRRAGLWNW